MADFAERLKQLRIQNGNSQQEIADLINVNKMTISGYERGIRRPAGENARKIYETLADHFNVDIPFLLGFSDDTIRLTSPVNEELPAPSINSTLRKDEIELLLLYNNISKSHQNDLRAAARVFSISEKLQGSLSDLSDNGEPHVKTNLPKSVSEK